MKRVFAGLIAACVASIVAPPAAADGLPGDFDFYVLALSWSPTYCIIENSEDGAQCGVKRHGFIAHGLWPQYERGYPDYCLSLMSDRVPNALARTMYDIVPSRGLVRHQWRKHGICSGLRQDQYFQHLRRAYEKISIPSAYIAPTRDGAFDPVTVERAFLDANPGLSANGIAVTCKQGHLVDVRICLTKDLEYRACPEINRGGCRASRIKVPAVR